MTLKEIKIKLIKSIDHNIEKTNNFTTLAQLKQCKRDLKNSNKNKTLYIIGYLKANTNVFNSYLDSIDYSNFNCYLFQS